MTVRSELAAQLSSWMIDRAVTDAAVDEIFDGVVRRLCRKFPDISRSAFDLILADAKRDSEILLNDFAGSVDLETVVEIISTRFLGED